MKKAIVLLARGFEEVEALTVVDVLRRGGVNCVTLSINEDKEVLGTHSILIKANNTLENTEVDKYDALIIPGGMPGAINLRDDEKVIELVKKFQKENKILAAICAGPIVFSKAGILDGVKVTSYPGFEKELSKSKYAEDIVVQDENIITSRGPATAMYFSFKILENLAEDTVVESLKKDMLVRFVEKSLRKQ
ncbi:DJ-1 family glyoxalase III [Haloimpatiens sp. FM7315]|uniref:DJ-1 family glyoxalase III n=1 Tax=Haloimpatiens sp. FM7315 TaxID=3298609 RepID=UPI0035A3B9E9